MWHQWEAGTSFLSALVEVDRRTAEQVRGQPCRCCRGPLHAGHYGREPGGCRRGWRRSGYRSFRCVGACAAGIAGGARRRRR